MLCLGTSGMYRELWIVEKPDLIRVTVCVGLLLGPAAMLSWWAARTSSPVPPSQPSESSSPSSPS